jgi:hypothetical protein
MDLAGDRMSLFDLSEHLRLADDQRVEAGGDAEQVIGRVGAAVDHDVRRQRVPGHAVVFADEAPARFGGVVGLGAGVDFRAVAGGQDHGLAGDLAGRQRRHRRVEAAAREIHPFAQLDRRGPVADSDGEQPHG